MIHLTVQSRGAPDGNFDGAPKDKDVEEVYVRLHYRLHLSCSWVAPVVALVDAMINGQMCTKWLFYGGPDAALEGALDCGLNVGFVWGP